MRKAVRLTCLSLLSGMAFQVLSPAAVADAGAPLAKVKPSAQTYSLAAVDWQEDVDEPIIRAAYVAPEPAPLPVRLNFYSSNLKGYTEGLPTGFANAERSVGQTSPTFEPEQPMVWLRFTVTPRTADF